MKKNHPLLLLLIATLIQLSFQKNVAAQSLPSKPQPVKASITHNNTNLRTQLNVINGLLVLRITFVTPEAHLNYTQVKIVHSDNVNDVIAVKPIELNNGDLISFDDIPANTNFDIYFETDLISVVAVKNLNLGDGSSFYDILLQ